MTILLILFAALFIFIGFLVKSKIRQAFIQSFIAVCFISYLFCELFSIDNALTLSNISLGWALVLIGSCFYLFKMRSLLQVRFAEIKSNLNSSWSGLDSFSKKIIWATAICIVLPLFLLAICVPPNNWDSMAYHMPRVMHWIQDKNIYPYPTHIYRQVLTSPLSEYVILNLQVLSGTDTFANLVQFFAFVGVLFAVSLIVQLLGVKFKGQLFIVLLVISLPMILFQATTTQTDLLATFFFIAFVYFTIAFIKKEGGDYSNIIFLALSLALGILTKYNVAIFAFPIALYLLWHLLKTKKAKEIIYFTATALFIAAVVLAPFIAQNIQYFGSATGQGVFDNNASIISDHLSIKFMLSNNVKLLADFVSVPVDAYNRLIHIVVSGAHKLIGVSENDAGNNWAGEPFIINNHLNEDTAGSLFHFSWMLISLFVLFKYKFSKQHLIGLLYFIFSFSLFSLLFRYSAFNFRLLLPLVTLLIVVCGYVLYKAFENTKWVNQLMALFFLIALLPVYFNRAKPIIADPFYLKRVLSHSPKLAQGNKTLFQRSKIDHYFAQNPSLQTNLVKVFDSLSSTQNRILLATEFDSYEYLVWVLAKNKLQSNFYIGYLPNGRYHSNTKNVQSDSFYNTKLVDFKSHWSIIK